MKYLSNFIMQETGRRCFYCGKMTFEKCAHNFPGHYTRDHLTPKAKGGSKTASNTVTCCLGCNLDKHHLTLDEYRIVIAFRNGLAPDEFLAYSFWGEANNELYKEQEKRTYAKKPRVGGGKNPPLLPNSPSGTGQSGIRFGPGGNQSTKQNRQQDGIPELRWNNDIRDWEKVRKS